MKVYCREVSRVKVMTKVVLTVMVLATAATCLGEEAVPDAQAPLSCPPTKCRRGKSRSVCGSNGRTYDSNCAFLRARCRDRSIKFKHVGPCEDSGDCRKEKRAALRRAKKEQGVFVPRCLEDGSFAPVQCHESTGYCFCMLSTGKAVPDTAVKNQKPKCSAVSQDSRPPSKGSCIGSRCGPSNRVDGKGESGNDFSGEEGGYRGGAAGVGGGDAVGGGGKLDPPHILQSLSTAKPPPPSHSRGCHGRKLKRFVKGIVQDFKKEFRRASEYRRNKGESMQVPRSKRSSRAIMYKFRLLDKDSNGFLTKAEYQKLRSIVRKKLKPKRCARSFPVMCDADRDNTISGQEWSSCLDTTGGTQRNRSRNPIQGGSKGRPSRPAYNKVNDVLPACLRERDAILDVAVENANTSMYFPNCTEDGRFVSKQCYGSAGKNLWFCWCVDEFNGKILYGTSMEGNCTQRPWKGCPRERQHAFLQDLQRFLNNSLTPEGLTEIRSSGAQEEHQEGDKVEGKQPKEADTWRRKVVTYYFDSFDKDSNGVLERRELKKMKKFVLKEKVLKRCGRRLINFCDGDDDGKVTKVEWTSCVAPGGGLVVIATAEPSTSAHRNSSINPFIDLLQPEDESNSGREA